jgi:hypothetical protein
LAELAAVGAFKVGVNWRNPPAINWRCYTEVRGNGSNV